MPWILWLFTSVLIWQFSVESWLTWSGCFQPFQPLDYSPWKGSDFRSSINSTRLKQFDLTISHDKVVIQKNWCLTVSTIITLFRWYLNWKTGEKLEYSIIYGSGLETYSYLSWWKRIRARPSQRKWKTCPENTQEHLWPETSWPRMVSIPTR